MQQQPPVNGTQQVGMRRQFIAQQQTLPQRVIFPPPLGPVLPTSSIPNLQTPIPIVPAATSTAPASPQKKISTTRIIAVFLVLVLAGAIYFIWHTSTPTITSSSSSSVSQQNFSAVSTTVPTTDGIKVYIVGAVKNPGIYTLAPGARMYDLLQAAGGTLPKANLVAINLAAKLSDGQEVYITQVGETPPTNTGGLPGTGNNTSGIGGGGNLNSQLVNINTASALELNQNLHISKKSAQAIVDYRTQHGDFSSVDQLAQVVSRTIYNKIKALCTI
ncbi:MAG: hypothetical protein PVS3B3_02920 [Ktedonobacteraceae bacterium]